MAWQLGTTSKPRCVYVYTVRTIVYWYNYGRNMCWVKDYSACWSHNPLQKVTRLAQLLQNKEFGLKYHLFDKLTLYLHSIEIGVKWHHWESFIHNVMYSYCIIDLISFILYFASIGPCHWRIWLDCCHVWNSCYCLIKQIGLYLRMYMVLRKNVCSDSRAVHEGSRMLICTLFCNISLTPCTNQLHDDLLRKQVILFISSWTTSWVML